MISLVADFINMYSDKVRDLVLQDFVFNILKMLKEFKSKKFSKSIEWAEEVINKFLSDDNDIDD